MLDVPPAVWAFLLIGLSGWMELVNTHMHVDSAAHIDFSIYIPLTQIP